MLNWILVDGTKYGLGQHAKKKRAQEEAAKQTLEMLGESEGVFQFRTCVDVWFAL